MAIVAHVVWKTEETALGKVHLCVVLQGHYPVIRFRICALGLVGRSKGLNLLLTRFIITLRILNLLALFRG